MKTTIAIAVATLALSGSLAQAGERCAVPMTEWKPRAELEAQLRQKGWEVRTIKTEDGCYEAYAIDDKGHRVESYFNPKTFERVDTAGDSEDEG